MTKKSQEKRYTPAMEQRLRDAAPMDFAACEQMASEFGEGYSARGLAAKIARMGLPYTRKQPVSKTGAPIEKKEDIVEEIVAIVGEQLDGLEKAPKQTLQRLRDALAG